MYHQRQSNLLLNEWIAIVGHLIGTFLFELAHINDHYSRMHVNTLHHHFPSTPLSHDALDSPADRQMQHVL